MRADNADQRLTPIGRELGLVADERWARYRAKRAATTIVDALCDGASVEGVPIRQWLKRPEADATQFAEALPAADGRLFASDVLEQILIEAKYSGYVQRQMQQIERFRKLESMPLPPDVDYARVTGLRQEAREQLTRVTPRTLGQAARISGINPADITVLWVHITAKRPTFDESSAA